MNKSLSRQFLFQGSTHPKTLITGGNGFVGSHLAESLSVSGASLYLLLRATSKLHNIEGLDYKSVIADLRNPQPLIEVLPEIEYIFHSAGAVKARSASEFMEVNAKGTSDLLALVESHAPKLKRFVYISSQAAVGPGEDYTLKVETDPAQPISDYGKSKRAGEEAVLSYREKFPVTIIRPSAVFGPRDTEVLTFFKSVKLGLMLKFGGKESFVSIVYVKDLVDGIMRAAFSDKGAGEIFFINTLDEASQWKTQQMMADAMKVDVRALLVPLPLLRFAGSIVQAIDIGMHRPPTFSRDKALELSNQFWLASSDKAKSLLGYKSEYSLPDAILETYNWYVEQGWL